MDRTRQTNGLLRPLLLLGPLALAACPDSAQWTVPVPDDDDATPDAVDSSPPESVPGALLEDIPQAEHPFDEAAPLCSITIDCDREIPDAPKLPCRVRVDDHDGVTQYDGWAGVELRGRSSSGFPKRHYNIELWQGGGTLIDSAGTWRYLDTGVDPGGSWNTVDYDDDLWAVGAAPLGYE